MPFDTWPSTLPGPADDNYEWSEQPRTRVAKFGDGYSQRTLDGLNAILRTFDMDWPNLDVTDKDTARDFLLTQAGTLAFYWTPIGEDDPILVICPKWSVKRKSGPYWSITVTFEQVFDEAAGSLGDELMLSGDQQSLADSLLLSGDQQD